MQESNFNWNNTVFIFGSTYMCMCKAMVIPLSLFLGYMWTCTHIAGTQLVSVSLTVYDNIAM